MIRGYLPWYPKISKSFLSAFKSATHIWNGTEWSRGPKLPEKSQAPCIVDQRTGVNFYVHIGRDGGDTYSTSFYNYNFELDRWIMLRDIGVPFYLPGCGLIK